MTRSLVIALSISWKESRTKIKHQRWKCYVSKISLLIAKVIFIKSRKKNLNNWAVSTICFTAHFQSQHSMYAIPCYRIFFLRIGNHCKEHQNQINDIDFFSTNPEFCDIHLQEDYPIPVFLQYDRKTSWSLYLHQRTMNYQIYAFAGEIIIGCFGPNEKKKWLTANSKSWSFSSTSSSSFSSNMHIK